jgi:A/G-specific adenine glycosylase
MDAFPTIKDLANSDIERVNQLWSGLGYYTRARNLHKGANMVVNELNGKLPNTVDGLLKIPGIGPYTAGAIASIAFNQPAAIADGNVFRVLSRLRAVYANSKSSAASKLFWKMAEELVDTKEPGDFNQAMMELGATVCTPRNPTCAACPVQKECMVYNKVGWPTLKELPTETDIEGISKLAHMN